MSFRSYFCAALAVCALSTAPAQAPDLSKLDLIERNVPDGPVASVDNRPISREEYLYLYNSEVAGISALQKGDLKDADRVNTALACMTELVQREVLLSEAERRKITVNEADVEDAYKKQLAVLQEGLGKKEGKQISEEDVLKAGGRTRDEAKGEMRKALLIEKVRDAIIKEKNVTVPESDIKEFYEQNKARFSKAGGVHVKQIFTRPKPDAKSASEQSWQEARQRIDKAIARVQTGENFEAVAKSASDAPNHENGGDLGTVPAEKLPPFYRDAVTKMKPGELSPVIKSEFGWHVILLVSTEEEKTVSYDDVKDRVRQVLLQGKSESVIQAYCRPIFADENRVKVFLNLDRAIASIPESERPKAREDQPAAKAEAKPAPPKPAAGAKASAGTKSAPAKAATPSKAPAKGDKKKK